MDQPDRFSETANDEEMNRAASFIVDIMRSPMRFAKGPKDVDKVFAAMKRATADPEGMKQEIIAEARKSRPHKLREDLDFILDFMKAPRRTVMEIISDALPAGTPGKRPKITLAVERLLVQLAQSFWPAVLSLIELRLRTSKRAVAESIQYLSADYPEASQMLLKHVDVVEDFFAAPGNPKGQKSRARRLALQVIAREFGLAPTYIEKWVGAYLK